MKVENVGDERVIRGTMHHFKPSALIRWRAENSQVSMTQFQIRECTDICQLQGLVVLAKVGQPKMTVGA